MLFLTTSKPQTRARRYNKSKREGLERSDQYDALLEFQTSNEKKARKQQGQVGGLGDNPQGRVRELGEPNRKKTKRIQSS
jgi:hypothetical protein